MKSSGNGEFQRFKYRFKIALMDDSESFLVLWLLRSRVKQLFNGMEYSGMRVVVGAWVGAMVTAWWCAGLPWGRFFCGLFRHNLLLLIAALIHAKRTWWENTATQQTHSSREIELESAGEAKLSTNEGGGVERGEITLQCLSGQLFGTRHPHHYHWTQTEMHAFFRSSCDR